MPDLNVYDIPIDDLVPYRKRIPLSRKHIERMVKSIVTIGLIEPLLVLEKNEQGKYHLRDGESRYFALKELGFRMVPCHIEQITFQY